MSVQDLQITGHPSAIFTKTARRVSARTRRTKRNAFKIGITNDPHRRWKQAYAGAYSSMVVLYRSSSWNNVAWLERELIEHNWNVDTCQNRRGGGGGYYGYGPYYLYVVVS